MPSLKDLILDHFKKFPKKPLSHNDWVDNVSNEYKKIKGSLPRDPWRAARKLYADGLLVKVDKGVYMYDPDYVQQTDLKDFTQEQKKQILERDGYKCVICGRGEQDGVELQVDHIRPKSRGGKAIIENGQTLCGEHNYRKKNYNQTETGKKMFIRLYKIAKNKNDAKLLSFIEDLMKVYEKHGINGHIEWNIDE